MIKKTKCLAPVVSMLLCYLLTVALAHADQIAQPAEDNTLHYSDRGADTCIKCHDEDSKFPVFNIFKTKHAMKGDARTPFAGLQCEACHGPGVGGKLFLEQAERTGSHVRKVRPGHQRPLIITFGAKSQESVSVQNGVCLQCHQDDKHIDWQGSPHEANDVACVSCHAIHTPHDQVLDKITQPEVCYRCHQKQRVAFSKPSNHPVRFGQMSCSDCHESHGSATPMLLKRPTLNETCYTCHADKRGPFLWEHEPVTEDCSLCHAPHGSIHPALLVKRPPLLCQQCHSQFGHPSVSLTPAGLAGGSPSALLLAGSCTNCHSQVHGSNHPSGVKMMR
jgi:DmsE family decaheme c-type cytochrome